MNIKKPLLIAGAAVGIGLAGATSIGIASAATNHNGEDGIVDKLATRFNLNKDEVRKVFEEEKTERHAEMRQHMEERLTKAVEAGNLTEEQKQKILAKQAELQAKMESMHEEMKDKSDEERKELKEQHREDLQKWAEDNDIPLKYLHFVGHGPGHGHGLKHKMMIEEKE